MALIEQSRMVRLLFRDDDNAESTCQTNLPISVSPASALTFLSSWRGVVSALSSAVCIEADIILRWTETTPGPAGVLSDVQRQGVFIFNTPVPDFATVRVISIDDSFLETVGPYAGIRIDQTLTAVSDFIAAITAGLSGIQPCDPFVNDLLTIAQAYKEQL
jgi:hypothetical protein